MTNHVYTKMTAEEYRRAFLLGASKSDSERILSFALDIRKFEIDLYWKRATYFWAFLAVTLAGYFTLLTAKDISEDQRGKALLIVSCLGFVFSVAWYFVNRGSKFWQENWEKHVDLLEDSVIGPLYKTVLSDDTLHFAKVWGPYPFSVSKLNQLLSLFFVFLFFLLAAATLCHYYRFGWPPDLQSTLVVILTIAAVVAFCWKGRSSPRIEPSRVRAERRQTEIV